MYDDRSAMAKQFHNRAGAVNSERLKPAFRRSLTAWYRRQRRDLPWRRTRDPYAIWVSEVMLQQTRVEAVQEHYRRWLEAFPTVVSLARARPSRVLRVWEGLGYYQRARNLQRAARILVHRSGEIGNRSKNRKLASAAQPAIRFPTHAAAWMELPGIGPYTAAAIASIAFGERVPVVDGNVARVMARVLANADDVRQARTQRLLAEQLVELMPHRSAGDFNQAMMELGALICTPTRPQCGLCPLRAVCRARAEGLVERLPNRGQRPTARQVTVTAMAVRDRDRLLVCRRPMNGELAGMWELPVFDRHRFRRGRLLATVRHGIMDRRITLRVVAAYPTGPEVEVPAARHRWVTRQQAARLAFAAGHRRAITRVFDDEGSWDDRRPSK